MQPEAPTCRGVTIKPGDRVREIVASRGPRTTFCFQPGVYRVTGVIVPKDGQSFIGGPGTLIRGAMQLILQRVGTRWVATNQRQRFHVAGTCIAGASCRRSENVFFDGQPLRRVMRPSELASGKFFFNYKRSTIAIADDPTGHRVEKVVAPGFVLGRRHIQDVVVDGFVVEMFGNHAQMGAIDSQGGPNWTIRNNEVRYAHGAGICFDAGADITGNYVHNNGQMGICGLGKNAVVSGNEIAFNNQAGFDPYWEAGGTKFVETDGLVVAGNSVHDNLGPGIWADHENLNMVVEGNAIVRNAGPGLLYELSYAATIRDNVVQENAHSVAGDGNIWWGGGGIVVSNSSDIDIYENTVEFNNGGIGIINVNRGSGAKGPFESRNVHVHHNTVSIDTGTNGLVTHNDLYFKSKGNVFENNTYYLDDLAARRFEWNNAAIDKDEWKRFGLDVAGDFLRLAP